MHFAVLALMRFDMCQTLMAAAIYSLESIYSVEFGLSLRPLLVVYMMIDASLTAYHDMPDPDGRRHLLPREHLLRRVRSEPPAA